MVGQLEVFFFRPFTLLRVESRQFPSVFRFLGWNVGHGSHGSHPLTSTMDNGHRRTDPLIIIANGKLLYMGAAWSSSPDVLSGRQLMHRIVHRHAIRRTQPKL